MPTLPRAYAPALLRLGVTALLASSLLAPASAHAQAPPARPALVQAPGYYRLPLGAFRVTVLSDGTAPRHLDQLMSKPADVRRAFADAHEPLPVELSVNCFLIDTGTRLLLVDTGAGDLFGLGTGRVVATLRAAGYRPEDVDDVLLTHIHGDHSGGLTVGGQRVFPRATVHVDRRDPEYWLSAAAALAAPAARQATFRQSHQTVDPYVQAGRLRTFDGPTELFPGVRALPAYGHTPGHTAYLFESEGQRLLLWGDIVHAAEVQFRDPTVTIEYDVAPDAAVEARQRLLADAAAQGYLVGGAHLAFPGLGHVSADPRGFSWHPLPYSEYLVAPSR